MKLKLASLAILGTLMTINAGCSSDSGVIRGQNPVINAEYQSANSGGQVIQAVCQYCGSDHGQGGLGFGWCPKQYHSFDYVIPKNLVYPPANQPAAVVQYPYYTLKGPDDFFMK